MSGIEIGGSRAVNGGRRAAECNREARGARQSLDLHHYPLNPAEARTCINYLVDRGGTYLPSPHLRVHPMSNDQLHHTSHSRYIRRHNVGVRSQHAPSSRPPSLAPLLSGPVSHVYLFGSLGRNLLIAKVHGQRGKKENLPIGSKSSGARFIC